MNPHMKIAIEEARKGIQSGHGGPFGCVIVKDGIVIGKGHNEVISRNDPTCHGEIMAIRDACAGLGDYDLSGCELYTTAQPCPMCLGAIRWANISKIYYGCNINDTDAIGFRDKIFYEKGNDHGAVECDRPDCLELFKEYMDLEDRKIY